MVNAVNKIRNGVWEKRRFLIIFFSCFLLVCHCLSLILKYLSCLVLEALNLFEASLLIIQIFFFFAIHWIFFLIFKTPGMFLLLKKYNPRGSQTIIIFNPEFLLPFISKRCVVVKARNSVSPFWRLSGLFLQTQFRWWFH